MSFGKVVKPPGAKSHHGLIVAIILARMMIECSPAGDGACSV